MQASHFLLTAGEIITRVNNESIADAVHASTAILVVLLSHHVHNYGPPTRPMAPNTDRCNGAKYRHVQWCQIQACAMVPNTGTCNGAKYRHVQWPRIQTHAMAWNTDPVLKNLASRVSFLEVKIHRRNLVQRPIIQLAVQGFNMFCM